jgi:hypothetical protein
MRYCLIYLRILFSLVVISVILTLSLMIILIYLVILGLHELFVKLTGKGLLDYPLRGIEWVLGGLFSLILIVCRFMVGKRIIVVDKKPKGIRIG